MLDALRERFQRHDRQALARLLSLAARGVNLEPFFSKLVSSAPSARVVAITGSGGVGKSTLIGRLLETIRLRGPTVAVLACDPESSVTGGALLGDRVRMPGRPEDDGVFIRSLAAASGHEAVAENLNGMIRLLTAFGFEVILIETAGAGQGDVAVRNLADVVVLLVQPETGDDLQWEKAGLLEVADLIVVQKADLPGAERVEAQLRGEMGMSPMAAPGILRVSAKTGEGIDDLWTAIAAISAKRTPDGGVPSDLLHLAQARMARWFAQAKMTPDPALTELTDSWKAQAIGEEQAIGELVRLFLAEKACGAASEDDPDWGRSR